MKLAKVMYHVPLLRLLDLDREDLLLDLLLLLLQQRLIKVYPAEYSTDLWMM
jgi:hypothetical protein